MQTSTTIQEEQVRNGRFTVEIDGVEVTGFRHVTIPGNATEMADYREGEDSDHDRKVWGQTTYDDLEMVREVIRGDSTLRDWRDEVVQGKMETARKDLSVTLLTANGQPVIEWQFANAWIKEYEPPELVAGDGDVATESCTIVFEEMVREE